MKKSPKIFLIPLLAAGMISCEDYFLKKPMGNDLDENDIFSSEQQALTAIAQAYMDALCMNIAFADWASNSYGLVSGTLAQISGEVNHRKFNWETSYLISRSGMVPTESGQWIDGYERNFISLRRSFLIHDKIDLVPDMTDAAKGYVKGEMLALAAYRYCRMFIQYGGVPIIDGLVDPGESRLPRASLQEVLEHIIALCERAYNLLPDSWDNNFHGRCSKAVPLAIKAQALLYAARPLFNSAEPYMPMENPGENGLICFGDYNPQRWQDAPEAAIAVIDWSEAHGYRIINTGSPLDDYGTAVGTPNNAEVILAFKHQNTQSPGGNGNYYYPRHQSGGANGMSFYQLQQYRTVAGEDVQWPEPTGETEGWIHFSDFQQKVESLEPRYWASAAPAGYAALNNPDDYNWTPAGGLTWASNWEGQAQNEACGRRIKFWYKAGNRDWFDFPLYRLAYFYLAAAEAANEAGYPQQALQYLKPVRDRAGLGAYPVTEMDKERLRDIIHKEWSVEFYEENHRLFDIKHWKHRDIDNGMIGGSHYVTEFKYANGSWGTDPDTYEGYKIVEVYRGFWSPSQYLNPFPDSEINKGYLGSAPGYGQNPGY